MTLAAFPFNEAQGAFFNGFLDFVGYPVGAPLYPPVRSRGYKGAGKFSHYQLYISYMTGRNRKERRLAFSEISMRANQVKKVLENGWVLETEYRKNLAQAQMYTALLAEI